MNVVVVTGSRDAQGHEWKRVISRVLAETSVDLLIHGDCRGADRIAGEWCDQWAIPVIPMEANWEKFGKAAGPARNVDMIELAHLLRNHGHKVEVIGFHESRATLHALRPRKSGTLNCLEYADGRGFKTSCYDENGSEIINWRDKE